MLRMIIALAILAGCASVATGQQTRVVNICDCSGAVTAGGTSQVATPLNTQRDYLFVENPITATEALYVNYGVSASTTAKNSIELAPGGSINALGIGVPIQSVNVTAVTSAHAYICKIGGVQ